MYKQYSFKVTAVNHEICIPGNIVHMDL